MKKIVVLMAHPDTESFNAALANAYVKGAVAAGAEVRQIIVADLQFNPNLQHGFRKRTELEPDLLKAWETILWADHQVWVHPVWWGGLPALTKGFIDRLFLPGMAFKYRENSVWWDKLLAGKTAHIITTLDQPRWYYWLAFGAPSVNQLKKSILGFCGVNVQRTTYIGPIRKSTDEFRNACLQKVEKSGKQLK